MPNGGHSWATGLARRRADFRSRGGCLCGIACTCPHRTRCTPLRWRGCPLCWRTPECGQIGTSASEWCMLTPDCLRTFQTPARHLNRPSTTQASPNHQHNRSHLGTSKESTCPSHEESTCSMQVCETKRNAWVTRVTQRMGRTGHTTHGSHNARVTQRTGHTKHWSHDADVDSAGYSWAGSLERENVSAYARGALGAV
jgi:hypothetical protein